MALIRGKHFPRPDITQVNINQISQHSRLTWPGSCLPFQQSSQNLFILFVPPNLTSLCLYVPLFLPLLPLLSLLGTPFLRNSCLPKCILKSMVQPQWPPWIPPSLPFLPFPSSLLLHELVTACSGLWLLVFMSYVSFHYTRNSLRAGQE